jgi:hypothetical protein
VAWITVNINIRVGLSTMWVCVCTAVLYVTRGPLLIWFADFFIKSCPLDSICMYLLPEHCFSSSRIFPKTGTGRGGILKGWVRAAHRRVALQKTRLLHLHYIHLNFTQCIVCRNITVSSLSLLNDRCLIVLFICLLFYTECLSYNVCTWGVCLRRGVVNICTQLSALPPRL